MKYKLTKHTIDVVENRRIKMEWIEDSVENYALTVKVNNEEHHYFKKIEEASERCLKVVVNPIKLTIVTVYFDRNMRKRGCE